MQLARRISQTIFILFFLYLFFQAAYPYEHGIPVDLILRSSPLIAVTTLLTTKKIVDSLILGFIILFLTVFLGWTIFFDGMSGFLMTCFDFDLCGSRYVKLIVKVWGFGLLGSLL